MTEYIEREKLQEALKREKSTITTQRYTDGWNDCMLRVKSIVHSAPTAEVEPVRHGRLSETGMDEAWCSWGDCSACGGSNIMGSKYCNWCGVKLDGGAENGEAADCAGL